MSNSVAIAIITASAFSLLAVHVWLTKWVHELATEIVSGVARGLVVPIRWRWLMLYNKWAFLPIVGAAMGFVAAFINFGIASIASQGIVATLAYMVGLLAVTTGVAWLGGGLIEFAYLRSVLRQAEAG